MYQVLFYDFVCNSAFAESTARIIFVMTIFSNIFLNEWFSQRRARIIFIRPSFYLHFLDKKQQTKFFVIHCFKNNKIASLKMMYVTHVPIVRLLQRITNFSIDLLCIYCDIIIRSIFFHPAFSHSEHFSPTFFFSFRNKLPIGQTGALSKLLNDFNLLCGNYLLCFSQAYHLV